jgi:hypothetical protein
LLKSPAVSFCLVATASAFPAPRSTGAALRSQINVLHRSNNAVPVSLGGMTREADAHEHQVTTKELEP